MKRLLNIFIFSLIFVVQGYSQQYDFTNYSINEGLSQSVVNCIFQDSKGYIWVGTQNGLNRFTGETFDVYNYNPFDSGSLSNNWIYSIAEDQNGNLWIGTKGELNQYLPKQNIFKRITWQTGFTFDVSHYCYDIICLKNGMVFINTPPVVTVYDPANNSFSSYQSKLEYEGAVKDVKIPLLEDDDKIWIGSTKGLASFAIQTKEFEYYPFISKKGIRMDDASISALYKDKNGKLWAGTTSGLFLYDAVSTKFMEAGFPVRQNNGFPFGDYCIRSINEDNNGNLLLGTEGRGLFVLSVLPDSVEIQNYTSENSEIGHNIVQSLIIDKSENLWIGTLSGISKTDLKKKKFTLYRKSNSPHSVDLQGNVIASLFKDENGILWVGNWGQGLNLYNRNTGKVEHFSTQHSGNHKIPNDFIHVIFKDSEKRIWLGTRDGILIYDKPANRFISWFNYFKNPRLPRFENVRIYEIIQDKSSNYWIATHNGLYKVDIKNYKTEVFLEEMNNEQHISANLVYSLLEDSEGLIWIGTVSGLDVYNPRTESIQHFKKGEKGLSDDFVVSLCEDSHGKIWLGTGTYANRYSKTDSVFTYFSQDEGLPNNRIFEIVKDINGELWFATGKGLSKFDERQNRFHTFTPEDGLQSLEFNIRAAFSGEDGEILMGGMNGFNAFYPDSIFKNPYIPNLVFTSFYKTKGTSDESINLAEINEVVLNYNISSFTIEFAALEYTNPRKNNYSYQMQGISDDWVDIGNRKFVPFSGLQPGEYVFHVKGSNNDGVWNNNAIILKIIILPPWWRSNSAYFIFLLFAVLAVVAYVKMRERKLQQDKKILEQKVLERTLQIEEQNRLIVSANRELEELNQTKDKFFSIIGHDLGNQFNIIMGFLEVLVTDFKKLDAGKVEYHLNNILNSSKHAYDLLENLLTWSRMQTKLIRFNPEKFDVQAKITETIDLFEGALSKKNISLEFQANHKIQVFADKNMFSTVLRNLLANAIKFTNENGRISIQTKRKKDWCEISVSDNGVGISGENIRKIFRIDSKHKTLGTNGEKGTGLGLILCKEFIEKQHGEIFVESTVGKGSIFRFTLPVKNLSDTPV